MAGPSAREKAGGKKGRAPRERPLESPLNEERFAGVAKAGPVSLSVGEIAAAFFRTSGISPAPDERDHAVSDITGLLEDGYSRDEVLRAVEWFGRSFPKSRRLDRLAYYIHQALAE